MCPFEEKQNKQIWAVNSVSIPDLGGGVSVVLDSPETRQSNTARFVFGMEGASVSSA